MKKFAKWLIWFFPICMCILIFSFSSDDAAESTQKSYPLTVGIVETVDGVFGGKLDQDQIIITAEKLEFYIRKAGHMTEYAILAVSIMTACIVTYQICKKQMFFTWLFCVAYASSDEIHQLFVPGRSGRFMDVCIDSTGALIGIVLFYVFMRLIRRRKMKKAQAK